MSKENPQNCPLQDTFHIYIFTFYLLPFVLLFFAFTALRWGKNIDTKS